MAHSYDYTVFFYDRLAALLFAGRIRKAQQYVISFIPERSSVLIVGGGTGWILEEIGNLWPSGLEIWYVESSKKMVVQSKKRKAGENKIYFANQKIEDFELAQKFDVVLSPFFLDNFLPGTQSDLVDKIDSFLKPGGLWLDTDFNKPDRIWQRALAFLMLSFFRMLCGIESRRIDDTSTLFEKKGYSITARGFFFGGFLFGKVYRKMPV